MGAVLKVEGGQADGIFHLRTEERNDASDLNKRETVLKHNCGEQSFEGAAAPLFKSARNGASERVKEVSHSNFLKVHEL